MKKIIFVMSFLIFVQASGSIDPIGFLYQQYNYFTDFVNERNVYFSEKVNTLFKKAYAITKRIDNIDEKVDAQSKILENKREIINNLQNRISALENELAVRKRERK